MKFWEFWLDANIIESDLQGSSFGRFVLFIIGIGLLLFGIWFMSYCFLSAVGWSGLEEWHWDRIDQVWKSPEMREEIIGEEWDMRFGDNDNYKSHTPVKMAFRLSQEEKDGYIEKLKRDYSIEAQERAKFKRKNSEPNSI